MKKFSFVIPIYGFDVSVLELTKNTAEQRKEVEKLLKWIKVSPADIKETVAEVMVGKYNGADTYHNFDLRKFAVLIFPCTTPAERLNTIGHEKRHIEDRLLEHSGIDNIEASAFLAGFLSEKLFS